MALCSLTSCSVCCAAGVNMFVNMDLPEENDLYKKRVMALSLSAAPAVLVSFVTPIQFVSLKAFASAAQVHVCLGTADQLEAACRLSSIIKLLIPPILLGKLEIAATLMCCLDAWV